MKKVFLIPALLALGSLSLSGCGAQSNGQTHDETARTRTVAENQATTEDPDANGSPVPENDGKECPDGKCPDGNCHKGRHEETLPDGIVFHVYEFYFVAPEYGHLPEARNVRRDINTESPEIEDGNDKSESGIKRDKRPPRSRMPKKNNGAPDQSPMPETTPEN